MSGDPFATTTTVKNILQHIISPKLVSDGSGGYVSKTDLVNVHNIVFAPGALGEDGTTALKAFSTQAGVATVGSPATARTFADVYHSRVTSTSVIVASCQTTGSRFVETVVPSNGIFRIQLSEATFGSNVGWFIAKF